MIKTIYYYLKYRKINKYSSKDMKNYQFDEIKKKIDYAYNNFECYRKLYSENGVHPSDFKKIKDIEKFPIINKDLLESEIKKILKTENSYNWLSTTGSTGSPFNFPVDKNSMAMRRATHLISYKLFDKKVYDKTGIFWRDVRSSRLLKIKEFILRRYWFSIYNIKTKKNIISDKDFIEYNEVILKKILNK